MNISWIWVLELPIIVLYVTSATSITIEERAACKFDWICTISLLISIGHLVFSYILSNLHSCIYAIVWMIVYLMVWLMYKDSQKPTQLTIAIIFALVEAGTIGGFLSH